MDAYDHYLKEHLLRDTKARRNMFATILKSSDGLSAHEMARSVGVQDQTARDFIEVLLKHDLIASTGGRPERFKWALFHRPAVPVDTKSERKGTKRVTVSWEEEAAADGKPARRIRITVEGVPDNGTLKVSGLR
jgi:hypothetical protein